MPQQETLRAHGFQLQETPRIYVAALYGTWLLERTTPSWRIDDPIQGFQRIVKEQRARDIAIAVLDQGRTFPNSIVLATDCPAFSIEIPHINIEYTTRFLVVDGQHRLWAQRFSDFNALFSCVIHTGLTEVDMARLFLEINDNQKRVPSSLRWDLVRLVRPDDDQAAVGAAEMGYLFATDDSSPLYQRIDLTGEQDAISLKLGSVAPEFKSLFSRRSPIHRYSFEDQYQILTQYIIAIKEGDRNGWRTGESPFYGARVFRALIRLLPEIINNINIEATSIVYQQYLTYLERINRNSLSPEAIRGTQGEAGISAIYREIYQQIF